MECTLVRFYKTHSYEELDKELQEYALNILMEGRIWLESEPYRGSKFHFTIKLGITQFPPVRQIPEKLENLHGLKVLIVDDNATNRKILEEMLKNWKIRPTTADSAQSALLAMETATNLESRSAASS